MDGLKPEGRPLCPREYTICAEASTTYRSSLSLPIMHYSIPGPERYTLPAQVLIDVNFRQLSSKPSLAGASRFTAHE